MAVGLPMESMAGAERADLSFFSDYDPAIARLIQMREVARVLGSEIVSEMEFKRELSLAFMAHANPISAQSVVEPGVVQPKGTSLKLTLLLLLYVCVSLASPLRRASSDGFAKSFRSLHGRPR